MTHTFSPNLNRELDNKFKIIFYAHQEDMVWKLLGWWWNSYLGEIPNERACGTIQHQMRRRKGVRKYQKAETEDALLL